MPSRISSFVQRRGPVEDDRQRRARRLIDDGVDEEPLTVGGDSIVIWVRSGRLGYFDVKERLWRPAVKTACSVTTGTAVSFPSADT